MGLFTGIGAFLAFGIAIYLMIALIKPEWFS
ncbi:MAG TPA: potassium-transporting ATPase subunit F [Roseiflexaceae bacterium]|nr:potassium-transporting ATPase subunit F [Roseiflexaceae bacterium]HMP41872.1 potassium-transporting ATPase subunit F [Roseiflexaceae bacterium]